MDVLKVELTSKPDLITPYLGIFTFRPEERIDFLPGQYITLGVSRKDISDEVSNLKEVRKVNGKETVLRPYSIASPPENVDIELYIVWVQQNARRKDGFGVISTELFKPKPDIEYIIFSNKAKGNFLLPEDSRDVIMVATGTGIAPYMSILRSNKIDHEKRRYILIHGVSYSSDLAYKKELTNLQKSRDLTYLCTVSREKSSDCQNNYAEEFFLNRKGEGRISTEEIEEGIKKGRANNTGIEEILGKELSPRNSVIMLCGNPAMIKNIELIAKAKHYENKVDVITEEYW